VEDDQAILGGLLDVLVFNGYAAKGVADGGEGLHEGLTGDHDLILLDLMLPTMDGLTVCREIRKAKPSQGILMLTAKGSEDDVVAGFAAGADDYVSKPFSLRELLVRVEAILRRLGKNPGDETILLGPLTFDGKTLTVSRGQKSLEITRREMDIVSYLHHHRDRIVSKKALLTDVWHYADVDIETRTVDIHILKLRKKMQPLLGDMPLIRTVRGEGYRLADISQ
jgi:two-component system response regulator RegX3